ncbi:hypothetical protein QTH97_00715 [Variovorax sp. J22R24]|uniref:hypothetical protein n=1 Tax=Variovorax gracilis TaxID=3053502 RepID=UPI002577DB10|nr:hypothetical protein [Variovorax sp. J22R24]MDM0103434.1 hypothetical protein [Variovorax sp. J22R24]
MIPKQILDPLAMWRDAVDRLEGGVNSFTTSNMESEQFSQALAIVLRASLGTHHLFDKNMARLYERMGLPSRSEVQAIAASLRRIEDKLDMLLPQPAPAHRPARTRRAPAVAAEPVPKRLPPAAAPADTAGATLPKAARAAVPAGARAPKRKG